MSDFWAGLLQSAIRHSLGGLAVYAVSHGLVDQGGADKIIAGASVLAVVVWKWYDANGRADMVALLERMKGNRRALIVPFVLASALVTGLSIPPTGAASAADMVKAPARAQAASSVNDCTVTECSGFFIGANLAGIGTSADILGAGINQSIFGGGGLIGAQAEYQLWNGSYFAAFGSLGDIDMNINNTPTQNKFLGEAYVKLGVGLAGVFTGPAGTSGWLANLQNALLSPYARIGVVPFGHQGWSTGAGTAFRLGPLWELTIDYERIAYKSGVTNGIVNAAASDNLVRLGIQRKLTN